MRQPSQPGLPPATKPNEAGHSNRFTQGKYKGRGKNDGFKTSVRLPISVRKYLYDAGPCAVRRLQRVLESATQDKGVELRLAPNDILRGGGVRDTYTGDGGFRKECREIGDESRVRGVAMVPVDIELFEGRGE